MSPHAPDADHQAAALREALRHNALADTRHRAALARWLGVTHSELLAVEHLTLSHELTTGQLAARLQLSPSGATADDLTEGPRPRAFPGVPGEGVGSAWKLKSAVLLDAG